jgi:hypothetical protein
MMEFLYPEIQKLFSLSTASPETAAFLELVALSVSITIIAALLLFAFKMVGSIIMMVFRTGR